MAYLGKTPSQAVRSRYYFTAAGGETSLSGADDNANTLTFTDGNYVDVALNGVTLVAGTDYNTTTANTIGGLTALVASDVVEVIVYDTFSVFSGNVNGDFTVGGNITVTGTVDGRDVAADGTKLDGIEAGATADQTGAEIKASYEAEANTNAYTDAEKTKLTGIEASADVTDDTNVRAAGAVMTTGVSTLADSAYFRGAPTHGFRFNNNTDAYNNFIIRENGDTYTRGNAGIGSSIPEARLHVEGASTGQMMFRTSGSSVNKWLIGKNSSADFSIGEDGSEWLYVVRDSGNVGIGTTSPDVLLDIEGASATQHINATSGNANTFYQLAGTTTGSIEVGGGNSVYLTANNASGNMYFRTGGANTRMTIDSSGRVTMPYQPSFRSKGNNATYATTSPIPFANVQHNIGSHFSTSTNRFTAPIAGVYAMHIHIGFVRITAASGWAQVEMRVNGSTAAYSYVQAAAVNHFAGCSVSVLLNLNANDYVTADFGNSNGSYYGGGNECQFSGYLVG